CGRETSLEMRSTVVLEELAGEPDGHGAAVRTWRNIPGRHGDDRVATDVGLVERESKRFRRTGRPVDPDDDLPHPSGSSSRLSRELPPEVVSATTGPSTRVFRPAIGGLLRS